MKLALIKSVFTSYLASKLPCHPVYTTWSREHVLPKSLFPKVIAEDPRNIIPMPKEINQARGNRPYTIEFKDGYFKYACQDCPHPGFCRGTAIVTPHGLHPPNVFKGVIGRSVLYSMGKYPKFAEKISKEVLDIDTAIEWSSGYPMTEAEHQWIASL